MKKISKIFLIALFLLLPYSVDAKVISQKSIAGSNSSGSSNLLYRTGGNVEGAVTGIRITLTDDKGNKVNDSKTFEFYNQNNFAKPSEATIDSLHFYNKNRSNKANKSYDWDVYTSSTSTFSSNSFYTIKTSALNGLTFDTSKYSIPTVTQIEKVTTCSNTNQCSTEKSNNFFKKVRNYLDGLSDAINIEYLGKKSDKTPNKGTSISYSVVSKFFDDMSDAKFQKMAYDGIFITIEPITTYAYGNQYYYPKAEYEYAKFLKGFSSYVNESSNIDQYYNTILTKLTYQTTDEQKEQRKDFIASLKAANYCDDVANEIYEKNNNLGKDSNGHKEIVGDYVGNERIKLKDIKKSDFIDKCYNSVQYIGQFVIKDGTNYGEKLYSESLKQVAKDYIGSIMPDYNKYFGSDGPFKNNDTFQRIDPDRGANAVFYFTGTPTEAKAFNSAYKKDTVKEKILNNCNSKKILNSCSSLFDSNLINGISDSRFKDSRSYGRLTMPKKIQYKSGVELKYSKCSTDSNGNVKEEDYSNSDIGCGIIAISALYPYADEQPEYCAIENANKIVELGTIEKIEDPKNNIEIKNIGKQKLSYCCILQSYSDSDQNDSTFVKRFQEPDGDVWKACHEHEPSKTCTYEDFIAIVELPNDWGTGEEPANGIKTTPNPSKFVSKRAEDALWKDKLYACCSFENYDTDARKKIKEEYFVKKKIIGSNDKLKKPFNDLLKPKCKPSNVSDACNYTDYLVLKDIAEGSGKYSKSTLVHYNNEDTVYYACCKNVTSIGTNKEVIINQNKLKEVWDLTHYNPNGSAITTAQTTDLENVVRMACPAQDDKNPKCDYHETIEEGIRWGGKDGKTDCCIYDNVDPASLPSTLSTESKFKADINSRAETYDELKACISGQYCTLNKKREFVLPLSAKLQNKDESWCCKNNEGQWQDDEYYRNTIRDDLELKNKYHCTVNYCDWDILMKGGKVQDGTDCCKLSGFEQNNTLYTNIRTKLAADKKTVNGKLIKTNTKLTYIESNIDDAFTEAVKDVCPTPNEPFCTYEMIDREGHPCCNNYDRYSNDDKSQINNFSGTKVQKLHQWLAAKDLSTGQNRYQKYCVEDCAADTIVACPNCSKIISGTRNVETSYDTMESQDSTIRNTSEDIKECIVSTEKFNSTINESIGNDYCPVYCTEKIIYDYPKGLESVEAGRQYYLAPAYITTVKTCRINHINTELFLTRINSYYDQILAAYEEYKKYDTAIADANFSGSSYTYTSNSFIKKIEYDANDDTNKCDCINNTDHIKCCKTETSDTFTTTPTTSSSGTYVGSKAETTSSKAADCINGKFNVTCEWDGGSEALSANCESGGCDKICQNYKSEHNISEDVTGTGGTCTKDVSYYCPSSSSKVIDGVTYSGTLVKDSSDTEKCTYLYYKCTNIDITKYDYEVVKKYSYSNGVDSSKTNEQTTHACITNETGANLYSTQYNSSKAKAWSKVNSLYGQYLNEIQKLKDCFNIPEVIKNSEDYNFDIEASYMQADYEHTDQMLKELVSVNDSDQDQEVINRKTLTFKQSQTKKITIDTSRKLTVGTLEIENAYSGDLSKKIYSVKVERQYKYTLTTGYNYTLKGTPLSVKEKEKELQEVAIATHLPVSYENTENGTVTLKTSLSNLNSKEARSDLALCTVEENEDNAYVCDFSVYDRLILSPGILPVYRPIKLGNPFPDADGNGRNTGVNWCQDSTNCSNNPNINNVVKTYITNNRDVEEENVYRMTPLYTIKLSPMDIQNIRNYNKTTNYNDFRLVCDPNTGLNCQSIFLRGSHSTGWNADEEPYSTPSGVINNIYNLIVKDKSCAFFNGSGMNCRLDGKDLFAGGIN